MKKPWRQLILFFFIPGLAFFTHQETLVFAQDAAAQPANLAIDENKLAETKPLSLPARASDVPETITLDFKDADIRNVFKVIAQKAGVNIVATPEVGGNVTIRLSEVSWQKALDTIVKTYNFDYEWLSEKIIMVSTLEKLTQQRKAQAEAAEGEPLDTRAIVLNFSRAEDIKTAVEKLVSARGKITLESRANTLIISDIKSNLVRIEEIVKKLDKMTPQVMIEARIIETTLGSAEKLGIEWTVKATIKGAKRPTTLPFEPRGGSSWVQNVSPYSKGAKSGEMGDFPLSGTVPPLSPFQYAFPYATKDDFTFGSLDFTSFQAVLEALSSRSDTNVLSNPRITTINNQEAKMLVGTIVPVPIYSYSKETGTTVVSGYENLEIGIKLAVTPTINEQDYITLKIKPNVDEISSWQNFGSAQLPITSTRSAEAKVMIKDGHTIVMGGLISQKTIKSRKGIPILRRIPVLDLVFGKKEDTLDKTELLIFITPRIIRDGELSKEDALKLEEKLGAPPKKNNK